MCEEIDTLNTRQLNSTVPKTLTFSWRFEQPPCRMVHTSRIHSFSRRKSCSFKLRMKSKRSGRDSWKVVVVLKEHFCIECHIACLVLNGEVGCTYQLALMRYDLRSFCNSASLLYG